jgi:hypothetical protein
VEKGVLDHVLGFAFITHDAQRNPKDKARVTVKQDLQGSRVVHPQPEHCFFISGDMKFWEFWQGGRAFLSPGQSNRKRKRASLRRSTHGLIPIGRPDDDARDKTTVAPENSPDEAPMMGGQYTRRAMDEKKFRCGLMSFFLVQNRHGMRID